MGAKWPVIHILQVPVFDINPFEVSVLHTRILLPEYVLKLLVVLLFQNPQFGHTSRVNMSTTPTAPLTSSGGSSSPNNSHHHHRGHRLRQFLSPEGREVHIALSPEEAETLRRDLAAIRKDQAFDLVINGSPEHLEHLRRAHSHHESRREALRAKHGEAYDEFENVRTELDVLSSELHMLTDHAVSLDANFSKYGYSAHLRTYDDTSGGSSGKSSRAASIQGFHDDDHEVKKDWEAERKNGTVMKLYKKVSETQQWLCDYIYRTTILSLI